MRLILCAVNLLLVSMLVSQSSPRRDWRAFEGSFLTVSATDFIEVVIADDADEAIQAAAEMIRSVVGRTWGEDGIAVVTESAMTGAGVTLVLGYTEDSAAGTRRMALPVADAYEHSVQPRQRRITLRAADSEAVYLAAARWLTDEFGVRWYFPGALGEVLPEHEQIRLRRGVWWDRPAYWSRHFSVVGSTAESREWERRNGMRRHVHFGHNLNRIFTREVLLEHPEFAARMNGAPLIPPSQAVGWRYQPNLASAEVAEYTAAAGRERLAANPMARAFSVSINDNINFGNSSDVMELVEPIRFFRGRPDYSNLVFCFANRVAEAMGDSLDGRYLTALAYYWAEDVPGFPVDGRVLPILTADRSQYYDPAFRAADIDLMQRWGNSGVETFGLWDYYYGAPFIAPRLFFPAIEDSIRAAHDAGARSFYAEIIPIWAWDGAKNWIAARLTWDPSLDANALLNEYCKGLYGAGAEQMREILQLWSDAWMEQPGAAEWIKYYRDDAELSIYPDTLWAATDALLAAAQAAVAEDSAAAERIRLFATAYGVTRNAKAVFDARSRLKETVGATPQAIVEAIVDFRTALMEFDSSRDAAIQSDPLLVNFGRTVATRQSDPSLSVIISALHDSPEQLGTLVEAMEGREHTTDLLAALAVLESDSETNRFGNPTFTAGTPLPVTWRYPSEQPFPRLNDWYFFVRPAEATKVALQWLADREAAYILIQSTELAQLRQELDVASGNILVATIDVQGVTIADSRVEWMLEWLDADGKTIGRPVVDRMPHGPLHHWHTLAVSDTAPESAAKARLRLLIQRLGQDDWVAAAGPWCSF